MNNFISGAYFEEKFRKAILKIDNLEKSVEKAVNGSQACETCTARQCYANGYEGNSLRASGDFLISLIRQEEHARQKNFCIATSLKSGYVTSKQCCQGEDITVMDLNDSISITSESFSTWIGEHICFLNTTEIVHFDSRAFYEQTKQFCTLLMYDKSRGHFQKYQLQIQIDECFEHSCELNFESYAMQNLTILNGSSIDCDEWNYIGIVKNSKLKILNYLSS